MPPVLSGRGECQGHPIFKNWFLRIERSDRGRSGCVGKVLTQKVFFKRLGRFSSACTQQAHAWKKTPENDHFASLRCCSVPSGCKSCLGWKFMWNSLKQLFCRPHLLHLPGTPLIRVLQLFENRAQKNLFCKIFLPILAWIFFWKPKLVRKLCKINFLGPIFEEL